ncbi:MAG: hypothetical protein KBG20_15835 [Caldilineaceae bacterium]|nr:hypothetical protein [Caldilineaceae bacterium]MBP8124958.1 hypothetical protein [Caldilineaceae bacterium]MBP9073778.1 hypothetical protein [Caldilineaceae bacterium]
MIFTIVLVFSLLWAQNVGALTLGAATAGTSTSTIAYQGRLADSDGIPLTKTLNMSFRLYSVASGGVALWTEQWTGSNGVQVSDGLFNVMLGSLDPIPQSIITGNDSLFLGITVDADDEMSPRVQLGSVPFATQALSVPDGSITLDKMASAGVLPEAWEVAPLTADVLPKQHGWVDVADTSLTFTLAKDATVWFSYAINVQADGTPADDFLGTRLAVDGTPIRSSGMHYQPVAGSNPNATSTGQAMLRLTAGTHSVALQWASWHGAGSGVSWTTFPDWADGYIGGRSLSALAFYQP